MLHTLDIRNWGEAITQEIQQQAVAALESGQVIFLPHLPFALQKQESIFLSERFASPKTKNISFNPVTGNLQGAICTEEESTHLSNLLSRYSIVTKQLLTTLFPDYVATLEQARTSYRPVEIAGRRAPSYRKDDTRLHVDAFPSSPTRGKRILRVFSNINPYDKPRVWRLGAPFPKVVEHFHPTLKRPLVGSALLLNALKITKQKRSLYDHYMLQLHNQMKADLRYQEQVQQIQFQFPAGSSWIVYTDQVSHAAMAGQFTMEQTFYLPSDAMVQKNSSPLKMLENHLNQSLL